MENRYYPKTSLIEKNAWHTLCLFKNCKAIVVLRFNTFPSGPIIFFFYKRECPVLTVALKKIIYNNKSQSVLIHPETAYIK